MVKADAVGPSSGCYFLCCYCHHLFAEVYPLYFLRLAAADKFNRKIACSYGYIQYAVRCG